MSGPASRPLKVKMCVYHIGGQVTEKDGYVRQIRPGSCQRGRNCGFAHSTDELNEVRPPKDFQRPRCDSHYYKGRCMYGKECKFYHGSVVPQMAYEDKGDDKANKGDDKANKRKADSNIDPKASPRAKVTPREPRDPPPRHLLQGGPSSSSKEALIMQLLEELDGAKDKANHFEREASATFQMRGTGVQ